MIRAPGVEVTGTLSPPRGMSRGEVKHTSCGPGSHGKVPCLRAQPGSKHGSEIPQHPGSLGGSLSTDSQRSPV